MSKNKKIAAAMTAVMHYIKTQEETAAMQTQAQVVAARPAAAATGLWSASGRQAIMQMRSLVQMRTFKGLR